MTGETHILGGYLVNRKLRLPLSILFAMIKPSAVNVIAYNFLYEVLTLQSSRIGATLPDYDHKVPENRPNDLPRYLENIYVKVLKRVGASHRSRHTHNVDLWVLLLGPPIFLLLGIFILTKEDLWFYLFSYFFNVLTGILSHQYLDSLTVSGNRFSFFKGWKGSRVKSITPFNRTLYGLQPIVVGIRGNYYVLPLIRRVKRVKVAQWDKTGDRWEKTVRKQMLTGLGSEHIFKRIIEWTFLVLIVNSMHG